MTFYVYPREKQQRLPDSRVMATFKQERRRLLRQLGDLVARHGDECECAQCEHIMGQLDAVENNPPCGACDGWGCGRCQHTGIQ